MKRKFLEGLFVAGTVLSSLSAGDLYMGMQATSPSTGLSLKTDLSDKVSLQGIFDFLGDKTSYSERGIYKFQNNFPWDVYGFGEAGIWNWDRGYYHVKDETAVGYGFGVGFEYDFRGIDPSFIPLFASFEINYYSIDFNEDYYYYYDNDELGLGFGVHYKF